MANRTKLDTIFVLERTRSQRGRRLVAVGRFILRLLGRRHYGTSHWSMGRIHFFRPLLEFVDNVLLLARHHNAQCRRDSQETSP